MVTISPTHLTFLPYRISGNKVKPFPEESSLLDSLGTEQRILRNLPLSDLVSIHYHTYVTRCHNTVQVNVQYRLDKTSRQ